MHGKYGLLVLNAPKQGVFASIFVLKRNDVILGVNSIEVQEVGQILEVAHHGSGINQLPIWRNQKEHILHADKK